MDLALTRISLLPTQPISRLLLWLGSIQIYDGLLPLIIVLHSYRDQSKTALGLMVIWMAIRLIIPMVAQHRQQPSQPPFEAVFLALLLVNTRVIVLREDLHGPTDFLVIAIGLVIGARQSWRQWRMSFGWLALTAVLLAINLVWMHPATLSWTSTVVRDIYEFSLNGHGGINRFATILLFVTLSATSFFLLSSTRLARLYGLGMALIGYAMCLSTDSRLAQLAPPVALLLGWLTPRIWQGSTKALRLAIASLTTAGLIVGLWWFYLAPDAQVNQISDLGRFEAGACWLSLMFMGRNRFLYGVGFGPKADQMCGHLKGGEGFGHAHNTIAQMGGQLGVLGIMAFFILVLIVLFGLSRQRLQWMSGAGGAIGTIATSRWIQVVVGLNALLLMNALATTIYRGNQVNQCLIGFLASTSLCWLLAPPSPPLAEGLPGPTPLRHG
ncbi:MAG: hypothetical protein DCF24_03445 [Cyanobium sp.]|nr:MAG: hypothetical protein DCF24_03445 [Cyanobium sp.]